MKPNVFDMLVGALVREFKDLHVKAAAHTSEFTEADQRRLSSVVDELRDRGVL